jgi:hypothetical protein
MNSSFEFKNNFFNGNIFRFVNNTAVCAWYLLDVIMRMAFFWMLTNFFMFWEVAQLVIIGQYERWEWMRAKYRDLSADLVKKFLDLLIQKRDLFSLVMRFCMW